MKFYRTEWTLYLFSLFLIFISVCLTLCHIYSDHSRQFQWPGPILQTFMEWFDLVFLMNIIFFVVAHTPQIAPPLYTDGFFDDCEIAVFLFCNFLSRFEDIFIGLESNWLFCSRVFGYFGTMFFLLNDYILHCGFFVAWSTLAVQIDGNIQSLWGSYLITIQESRSVAVCIPKRNEVHIMSRSNVDLIMDRFWIPMHVVHRRIDLPNWALASLSHQSAAPG